MEVSDQMDVELIFPKFTDGGNSGTCSLHTTPSGLRRYDRPEESRPTDTEEPPFSSRRRPANVDEKLLPGSANSADNAPLALWGDRYALVDIYDSEAIDPAYQAESHAISCAIQEPGMGR